MQVIFFGIWIINLLLENSPIKLLPTMQFFLFYLNQLGLMNKRSLRRLNVKNKHTHLELLIYCGIKNSGFPHFFNTI